jgi:hypothetical protein
MVATAMGPSRARRRRLGEGGISSGSSSSSCTIRGPRLGAAAAAVHCGCWGALLLAAAGGGGGAAAAAMAAAAATAAGRTVTAGTWNAAAWPPVRRRAPASLAFFVPPNPSAAPLPRGLRPPPCHQPRRGYASTGPLRLNRLLFEPGELELEEGAESGGGRRCRVRLPGEDPRAVHVREVS